MDAIHAWVSVSGFIGWYAAMIGCLLWLFHGGKALATRNRSRRVVAEVLFAGAFFLVMGTLAYKMTDLMEGTRSQLSAPLSAPVQLDESWGGELPQNDRDRYSRMLASVAFIHHGVIVKYFDQERGWKEYCPTPDDRLQIQERAQLDARLQESAENGRRQAEGFWISGLMAFFFGLIHHRVQGAFRKR